MTYEDDAADLRGAHVPAGDVRPVRTVPTDVPPRTAAAIEANVRRRLDRNAQELTDRGWLVVTPEDLEKLERDEFGCFLLQVDPSAVRLSR